MLRNLSIQKSTYSIDISLSIGSVKNRALVILLVSIKYVWKKGGMWKFIKELRGRKFLDIIGYFHRSLEPDEYAKALIRIWLIWRSVCNRTHSPDEAYQLPFHFASSTVWWPYQEASKILPFDLNNSLGWDSVHGFHQIKAYFVWKWILTMMRKVEDLELEQWS